MGTAALLSGCVGALAPFFGRARGPGSAAPRAVPGPVAAEASHGLPGAGDGGVPPSPVADAPDPHLGASGHLVVPRRGDLAHLHGHPGSAATADAPTPGGHRLFLDFRHGGVVRTAEFTLAARTGR